MEWKFKKKTKQDFVADPVQAAFFTTEDVGNLTDALVRECIQNSIDARINKDNQNFLVKLRFTFGDNQNHDGFSEKNKFLKNLKPHLQSKDNGIIKAKMPIFGGNLPYLSIEDFNTTGLDGDVDEYDIPADSSPRGHNFYWFWRNIGKTGKSKDELGKWGLGKTVFPASSLINSFWGLTSRWDDKKELLMGQSVMKSHHVEDNNYIPYGFFGEFNDPEAPCFSSPIEKKEFINEFKNIFNLKRGELESGLSIVIPAPIIDINFNSVTESILKQYFYPILNNNLIAEIFLKKDSNQLIISNETIFHVLSNLGIELLYKKLFNLCQWSIAVDKSQIISLKKPDSSYPTSWTKDLLTTPLILEEIEKKKDDFENEMPVGFRIFVRIKKVGSEPEIGDFFVFLQKDNELEKNDIHFVRGGITVPGAGRKVSTKSIRAIILIKDNKVVQLLGHSENPAHTEWQKGALKDKYDLGDRVISFIESSVDKLVSYLQKPAEGIDRDIMKNIFFISNDDSKGSSGTDSDGDGDKGGGGGGADDKTINEPFILQKKIGGFLVKKDPKVEVLTGKITIQIAYLLPKGNSLKNYSKYDFDLNNSNMSFDSKGISSMSKNLNIIDLELVDSENFQLVVSGFDSERDLFIKCNFYDQEI